MAGLDRAGVDALLPVSRHGHPGHRGASDQKPRRGLPPVSADNQRVRAVVSQGRWRMTAAVTPLLWRMLEADALPDAVIRAGIRRVLAARLVDLQRRAGADPQGWHRQFVADRSVGPVAVQTAVANAQHYEVPTAFYRHVLGPHLKYSSAWWDPDTKTLGDAEARMLALSASRADLQDGQRVLELGCGWGSLSLWMARRFPHSEIVAVSNSRTQKAWIDDGAARDGLTNLRVVTADMNGFEAPGTFDRVVSVEMFEHMRNWRVLLERIARWLRDDGALFVHIFTNH